MRAARPEGEQGEQGEETDVETATRPRGRTWGIGNGTGSWRRVTWLQHQRGRCLGARQLARIDGDMNNPHTKRAASAANVRGGLGESATEQGEMDGRWVTGGGAGRRPPWGPGGPGYATADTDHADIAAAAISHKTPQCITITSLQVHSNRPRPPRFRPGPRPCQP